MVDGAGSKIVNLYLDYISDCIEEDKEPLRFVYWLHFASQFEEPSTTSVLKGLHFD